MSQNVELLNRAQRERSLLEQGSLKTEALNIMTGDAERTGGFSLRDVMAVLFRQRRVVALSFVTVLLAAFAVAVFSKSEYEAEAKILVEQTRQDPIVTSSTTESAAPNDIGELTEENVNSEVDLLESNDVLEKVVVACGLDKVESRPWYRRLIPEPRDQNIRIARAVANLGESLHVEPVKKSNLIAVSYRSNDPILASRVLNALSGFYLEKHVAVHRPPGAYEFFQKETIRFRTEMNADNQKLLEFNQKQSVVAPEVEKANVLQQLAQFESTQEQTNASIAETQNRIRALKEQLAATPRRQTTQIKTSSVLLEQLQAHLFDLEQQRLTLLSKFEPTYRPVQELEKAIASTRAAVSDAEKSPLTEQTTDGDPTYTWLASDLAKSTADLATLQARAVATERIVDRYQERAHQLDEKSLAEQNLLRSAKLAEDGYLANERKEEEARMSDALDQHQIVNVAIAEAATIPYLPVTGRLTPLLWGVPLALLFSFLGAFWADRWDHSFRTPEEVEFNLQIPVLAAMPRDGN